MTRPATLRLIKFAQGATTSIDRPAKGKKSTSLCTRGFLFFNAAGKVQNENFFYVRISGRGAPG